MISERIDLVLGGVLIRARIAAADAALDGLEAGDWTRDDSVERLRRLYAYGRRRFATLRGELEDEDGIVARSLACQRLMHAVIEAQREAIVRLRNERAISSEVMRRVERLDLEEPRLEV